MRRNMRRRVNKFNWYLGGVILIGSLYLFLSVPIIYQTHTVEDEDREVKLDLLSLTKSAGDKYDADRRGTAAESLFESIMTLPEWYKTRDWGLRKNLSLETVIPHTDYPWNDDEEKIAWNNFFFGTTRGLVLELGAMDGKEMSVSQFFEAEVGWRSILIEGEPQRGANLNKNRPNAISFHTVICEKRRTVHYVTSGAVGGIIEFMDIGFLKTFHSELLTNNGELDQEKVVKAPYILQLPCVPLSDLLIPLKIFHVNFFMLDVEGGELNVLRAIDFTRIKFDVIAVETDRRTESKEVTKKYVDSVIKFLTSKGYVLWIRKMGRNSWFRHPEFRAFSKH